MMTYMKLVTQETESTRACPACLLVKPLDNFNNCKAGRKGKQSYCRVCQNAQLRKRRRACLDTTTQTYLKLRDQELEGFKVCKKCLKIKPLTAFPAPRNKSRARKGTATYCRDCFNKLHVDWRKQREYGLTPEDMRQKLQEQDHVCAICGSPERHNKGHILNVDHNHSTGGIRGLLCTKCNRGLGLFKDKPSLLRKAAKYLEVHNG